MRNRAFFLYFCFLFLYNIVDSVIFSDKGETAILRSNLSGFFISNLIRLFAIVLCLPGIAVAQSGVPQVIELPFQQFVPNGFVVYGRAETAAEAGIIDTVRYTKSTQALPDLSAFFTFGGTLELVTLSLTLSRHDVVISEIMWGFDEGIPPPGEDTNTQWIELYNTYPGAYFVPHLFLLFTPFESYPDRETVTLPDGQSARVLDTVSNLHLGKWKLPGKKGRRPYTTVVSAYRNITYADDENAHLSRSIIPFGSYPQSWKATPDQGRRNTLLDIIQNNRKTRLPYIATPGAPHVSDRFLRALSKTPVQSNRVIINEVRNDLFEDTLDWIELKNVSRAAVQLENWELSIVTGVGLDIDLVGLPNYEMAAGEILLIQAQEPKFTALTAGINITDPEGRAKGATHKYLVDPGLSLPNTGKFVLLLRSASDQNGQDAAIEDYAGNGFFSDSPYTDFWPRRGQPRPTDVAYFGNFGTFGATDSTWARIRYSTDNGHHKDAWEQVSTQGGIGYDPQAEGPILPGTPGYENTALKTQRSEYTEGKITLSEIMVDAGSRHRKAQWIELYNSSFTQAVNLDGWVLEVRNLENDTVPYVNGSFIFNEVILLPNQTVLLVSKDALHNVIERRVYDLHRQHRSELQLSNRWSALLNPEGFYLKLMDRSEDGVVIDEAGNLSVGSDEPSRTWELPVSDPEVRLPLVRQYKASSGPVPGGRSVPSNFVSVGTSEAAWRQADKAYVGFTYYGDSTDRGTPGHRSGSPLPVVLSSFHPERSETGAVLITWATVSELNNAGFNILRSEGRDGVFAAINRTLILGAGTSGEKHTYTFTDTTAAPGVVYHYRIEDVSFEGVRRTLATVRLKGQISAVGKVTTTWGQLKTRN